MGSTANTMPTSMTCCSVCMCQALPVTAKVAAAAQGPIDMPARPALNMKEYTCDLEPVKQQDWLEQNVVRQIFLVLK